MPRRAAVGGAEERDGGDGLPLAARAKEAERAIDDPQVRRARFVVDALGVPVGLAHAGRRRARGDAGELREDVVAGGDLAAAAADGGEPEDHREMSRVRHQDVCDVCVTAGATRA